MVLKFWQKMTTSQGLNWAERASFFGLAKSYDFLHSPKQMSNEKESSCLGYI